MLLFKKDNKVALFYREKGITQYISVYDIINIPNGKKITFQSINIRPHQVICCYFRGVIRGARKIQSTERNDRRANHNSKRHQKKRKE